MTLNNKICYICNQSKSIMAFNKYSRSKDGFATKCRECEVAQQRQRTEHARNNIVVPETSQCTKCKEVKEAKEFRINTTRKCGLHYLCLICEKKQAYIVIPESKQCYHCKDKKPASDFRKNNTKLDGLEYICKICKKVHKFTTTLGYG